MSGLKKYVIDEEIGRGAMGVVYKARPKRKKTPVALKEFSLSEEIPQDRRDEFVERFKREATVAAAIDHAGVVKVLESFEDEGRLFLAMEFIEAPTLARVLKDGPLPPERAVPIVLQVLEVVAAIHAAGVVHRDLKPSNVFLLPDDVVKVADFGVAHVEGEAPITQAGAVLGTVGYMSPEQLKGEEIDSRSDLFCAGVLLYEMLSGTPPFGRDAPTMVMYRIAFEEPQPLSALQPDLPSHLGAIIAKATQKDPAARYESVKDMEHDLVAGTALATAKKSRDWGAFLKERAAAISTAVKRAVQPTISRFGPANVAVVLGVVVIIAAMAGFVVWRNGQARVQQAKQLQAEAGRVATLRVESLTLAGELSDLEARIDSKAKASVSQLAAWDKESRRRKAQYDQAWAAVQAFNDSEQQKQAASMVSTTDWWGTTTTYYTYTARSRPFPSPPKPPAPLQFNLAAESSSLQDIQKRAEQLETEAQATQRLVYLPIVGRKISAVLAATKTEAAGILDSLDAVVMHDSERGSYASQSGIDSLKLGQTTAPITDLDTEIDLELDHFGLPASVLKLPLSSVAASASVVTTPPK
jgi:tRNA A-37 threonylcarbamoyl transferase component Bud32